MNEDEKKLLTPWMHVAYISCIFVVVLICVIVCMSKDRVSDAAFDNVSFAATIVSIVLAVVSIVVSVVASFRTYQNLGGMTHIEGSLLKIVSRLEQIGDVADKTKSGIDDLRAQLMPATAAQINSSLAEDVKELNKENKKNTDSTKESTHLPVRKSVYTTQDLMMLQHKAVLKIANEYELHDVMFDTRYRFMRDYVFDGVANRDNMLYVIEVSLYSPDTLTKVLGRIERKINAVRVRSEKIVHGFAVFMTQDGNDTTKILEHVSSQIKDYHLTPKVYTFSELE